MTRSVPVAFLVLSLAATVQAATIHVYSGQSIQTAINSATTGDEIHVHAGTYVELIDLLGKAITLRGVDGPDVTIIDGDYDGPVITCPDPGGAGILIEGFTITRGFNQFGGGMSNGSNLTLTNCRFINNSAISGSSSVRGGAICNSGQSLTLTNCTFVGNRAFSERDDSRGGAIYNDGSIATVTGCTFIGNSDPISGAAMCNLGGDSLLVNCRFTGNEGCAVWTENNDAELVNCTFTGNRLGGMLSTGGQLLLVNCIFSQNYGRGMGIGGAHAELVNCTFSGNLADYGYGGGGIYLYGGGLRSLTNCIFWGNSATIDPQISDPDNTATVSYSCIQGGWAGLGSHNIDADPLLDQALRLTSGSPCIDAGDNEALPHDFIDLDGDNNSAEPLPLDLYGQMRFVDDPATPDTGNGTPPIVDIGACEYAPPSSNSADLDGDGDVDMHDFELFQQQFTGPQP